MTEEVVVSMEMAIKTLMVGSSIKVMEYSHGLSWLAFYWNYLIMKLYRLHANVPTYAALLVHCMVQEIIH